MSDLVPYEGDRLSEEARAEIIRAADKAREIQGTLINDLQAALNMIRTYQRCLDQLMANDPVIHEANTLLRKYKMSSGHTKDQVFKVYADGRDITETPDAIESSAEPERVELIMDNETGAMKFIPVETDG